MSAPAVSYPDSPSAHGANTVDLEHHSRDSLKNSNEGANEWLDKVYVYRVVALGILLSLTWKIRYLPFFWHHYDLIPLHDDFFPSMMQKSLTWAGFQLLPIALIITAFFVTDRRYLLLQGWLTGVCMLGLCWHQLSYNDVTFLTCLWVSLWSIWYLHRMKEPAATLYPKAAKLVTLIFSMILLGGAVGKLTPGYWSGEVFYEIYFAQREFWIFSLLRQNLSQEMLTTVACYYSRFVIITEVAGAGLWLLPPRLACALGIAIFLSIALFSNTNLFSVMCCLLGLGLVGLHQPRSLRIDKVKGS